MNNKVFVEVIVPDLEETFNIFIPINRRIGHVIVLINKALSEMTNGNYIINNERNLYSQYTGTKYSLNLLIRETDIRNGSKIVLL